MYVMLYSIFFRLELLKQADMYYFIKWTEPVAFK